MVKRMSAEWVDGVLDDFIATLDRPYELVIFDPDDFDTYPSVCVCPGDVERRFALTGGELLAFEHHGGSFVGRIIGGVLSRWQPGVAWPQGETWPTRAPWGEPVA